MGDDRVREEGYTLEQGLAAVGAGWGDLVRQAFKSLPDGEKIVQVKQKYGVLRIYTDKVGSEKRDELYQSLLNRIEATSVKVCETCGKPGTNDTHRGGSYTFTACPEHSGVAAPVVDPPKDDEDDSFLVGGLATELAIDLDTTPDVDTPPTSDAPFTFDGDGKDDSDKGFGGAGSDGTW